jgi:hypothetical protein
MLSFEKKFEAWPEHPLLARITRYMDPVRVSVYGAPKEYEPAVALPIVLDELSAGRDSLRWSEVKAMMRLRGLSWAQVTALHRTLGHFVRERIPRAEYFCTKTPILVCAPWAVVGVGSNCWRLVRLAEEEARKAVDAELKRREDERREHLEALKRPANGIPPLPPLPFRSHPARI